MSYDLSSATQVNVSKVHTKEMEKKSEHQKQVSILSSNHFFIIVFGVVAIAIWITMFGLGIFLNSAPYRDALLKAFDWAQFVMSVVTFTPTNLAILCLVSAFLGGCASLLIINKAKQHALSEPEHTVEEKQDSHIYMSENPFSSMLRGFIVFFAFLAGVFITNPSAFVVTTPQLYTQAAGAVSFLAFVVGYDPTMFKSFVTLGEKLKKK